MEFVGKPQAFPSGASTSLAVGKIPRFLFQSETTCRKPKAPEALGGRFGGSGCRNRSPPLPPPNPRLSVFLEDQPRRVSLKDMPMLQCRLRLRPFSGAGSTGCDQRHPGIQGWRFGSQHWNQSLKECSAEGPSFRSLEPTLREIERPAAQDTPNVIRGWIPIKGLGLLAMIEIY